MKRAVAFGMAMITALTLLAGCGAQGNSDAAKSNADGTESSTAAESAEEDSSADARGTEESVPAGEKVTITIYQSKIEANEGYKKAIEAYQTLHPEVTINLEAVTGNDFGASLKAKMQSDPPTIFSVGGFQDLKDYGDILEDLSDQPILEHALEGTTDIFTTEDGKVLAVPLYMEGYGFVVNRQMFEDAGVDFDSMMTYEGWLRYIKIKD